MTVTDLAGQWKAYHATTIHPYWLPESSITLLTSRLNILSVITNIIVIRYCYSHGNHFWGLGFNTIG